MYLGSTPNFVCVCGGGGGGGGGWRKNVHGMMGMRCGFEMLVGMIILWPYGRLLRVSCYLPLTAK